MEILVSLIILILLFSTIKSGVLADPNDCVFEEVRVGLVADLGSIEGKILKTSFSLALSDFYRINNGYGTRVTLSSRDSEGDPLLAVAAAIDLLKKTKVEVIVGVQSLQEANLLAAISEKAKVPVISTLTPNSLSLNKYDHFIQFTHDTKSEAKGITSLIHDFKWKSVVVIYEDVDDWRESLQILVENFQDEGIHISRVVSFVENDMVDQLRELKVSREAVFVVHMSEILVSRLFRCVEKLGLMEEGYAWILTTRTMNNFHYSDQFAIKSMQGVIGFKTYIQESEELKNFTSRLRKLMVVDDDENVWKKTMHSSVWAHDIACILAIAVEKKSIRDSATRSNGLILTNVSDLLESRFKGMSGDIRISNNEFLSETFEIVNIVGGKEKRVGLWSCGSFRERRRIVWPGESGRIPKHRFLEENGDQKKLLRVLVTAANRVPNLVSFRSDPETGVNNVTGFCVEVFKTSIAPLNYELEFIPYRGNNDNLAYLLSTQGDKYDAAVGDITITSNRSSYVDFTLPYTDIGIGILTVKKKSEGMWSFFDPFEKSLWLASGAFFILTGIVVWLVERPVNPEFQGSWGQQLSIMLWFGFSTIVFAHREKLQKMSSKFLVIVWLFVVLILTTSYGANLTSIKTISRIQLNHREVFTSSMLNNVRLGSINAVEAYAQVLRDGTLTHVINEMPYLSILIGNYPDDFVMTDRETNTNGFGFMFQKGSGMAPKVSQEIVKLRSLGTLKDMEKKWFRKLDSPNVNANIKDVALPNEDDDEASRRFTFRELSGLFIIAGFAHVLVLAVHLVDMRLEILRLLNKLRSFSSFHR